MNLCWFGLAALGGHLSVCVQKGRGRGWLHETVRDLCFSRPDIAQAELQTRVVIRGDST